MKTITDIKNNDLTNKGIVKMIDEPWIKDGVIMDRIVITTKGSFRESDLIKIDKEEKVTKPLKDLTTFDNVMSIDIRPGKVSVAKRIKDTDKLIHLIVKTSLGMKNVVTNLGNEFEPEVFVGKTFMFIMNMSPVKMKGVLSEAMIIASEVNTFDAIENKWNNKTKLVDINIPIDSILL